MEQRQQKTTVTYSKENKHITLQKKHQVGMRPANGKLNVGRQTSLISKCWKEEKPHVSICVHAITI